MQVLYRIYELSAQRVLGYAEENGEEYSYHLTAPATERCKVFGAIHEQEDNALFFQTMCVLHGEGFHQPEEGLVTDLSEIIFYMDFSGIFDRYGTDPRTVLRQKKAEAMFRPEGVTLDLGAGPRRYLAFERSGSMSRSARLSFIWEDFYEPVRRRVMMDLEVSRCQLSKLYAYNGLMLSGGTRIEGVEIDKPHRVVVVDNPVFRADGTRVITVEGDDKGESIRRYRRVERQEDIEILAFDGEGLISKEYAKTVDLAYCGKHIHHSFQVRMPYVKGMLHAVDFKDFLKSSGTDTITDLWGQRHRVEDVDVILTRSMFKGFGWFTENGKTWEDYWTVFRKCRHALYITNAGAAEPEKTTELNFQFLNTVSITAEEFRPADLPMGWEHSPQDDPRSWITKETETEYYNLRANEEYRRQYFLKHLKRFGRGRRDRKHYMAQALEKNPAFIHEKVFANELDALADKVLIGYSLGRLRVAGDNRYLSGDLIQFLAGLIDLSAKRTARQQTFLSSALAFSLGTTEFYAPKAAYECEETCTLLRNPHIARNEELRLAPPEKLDQMRRHYLGHLSDIVMVDAHTLAAERLGGADYDGDMVRTVADSLLNRCVARNYDFGDLANRSNLPLLKIPSEEAVIRDAGDWHDRFVTVRDTFSSRVGQISNAALDRSVIAYNENSKSEDRRRYREDSEVLAILTGLEIDSAKTGVKPDLSEYLGKNKAPRSLFLKYKYLVETNNGGKKAIRKFIEETDWSGVDSNLERLPLLAYQLEKHTPSVKEKPTSDGELFSFAVSGWKDALDPDILAAVKKLISEYDSALARVRLDRKPSADHPYRADINRILYARGQESLIDPANLYAAVASLPSERVTEILNSIREEKWHFLSPESRMDFLRRELPEEEFGGLYDLLADFRMGGYRILGDLLLDMEKENYLLAHRKLHREDDSPALAAMIDAYENKTGRETYKDAIARACRKCLEEIAPPGLAVRYVTALNKRYFLWDVLPDKVAENARKEERHA